MNHMWNFILTYFLFYFLLKNETAQNVQFNNLSQGEHQTSITQVKTRKLSVPTKGPFCFLPITSLSCFQENTITTYYDHVLAFLTSPNFGKKMSQKDILHSICNWKRLWCWEGLGAGGEGDDRGWDGWMATLTQRTWVWVNSGRWWWTGRPGVLQFMGSQRVGHNWATELNWVTW